MPTYGLLPTGFVKPTLEQIQGEWQVALRADIDETLDLSPDQPFGQVVGIASQREAALWEVIETLANMVNPKAAEGSQLENTCALTGTKREPAKKSLVTLNCNVDADFTAAAGLMMANVSGQETIRFVNQAAVDLTGQPAGVYPITFEAENYGPVVAYAGTLTVITAPVSGWNSCTNPADAERGSEKETDTSLRARREDEVTSTGSCTTEAIRADVLQVAGVQQCFVFENVTLATDVDGLPGKSFETVIYDGNTPEADDAEVAMTIWKSKPSGAETHGTTSQNIVDAMGQTQTVNYSRSTVKNVYLNFEGVVIDPEAFPANGVELIKSQVADIAEAKQRLGGDVISVAMKAAALTVPGVIDVPTLKLGFSASPVGTANLSITGREIADIDTSRIVVSTIEGTP